MQKTIMMRVAILLCGIYKNTNLKLPNLRKLGLYNIDGVQIPEKEEKPIRKFWKSQGAMQRKK